MNNLNEIITEIKKGEEAKEEIKKIKKILNNDGTISVIDQITYLQKNTSVKNITLLTSKLSKLHNTLNDIENEYDDMSRALDSAKDELDVNCYGDDIQTLYSEIDDLKDDILTNKEYQEPPAKKTSAKKTTPFSNDDKNSLLDVIEDKPTQQK